MLKIVLQVITLIVFIHSGSCTEETPKVYSDDHDHNLRSKLNSKFTMPGFLPVNKTNLNDKAHSGSSMYPVIRPSKELASSHPYYTSLFHGGNNALPPDSVFVDARITTRDRKLDADPNTVLHNAINKPSDNEGGDPDSDNYNDHDDMMFTDGDAVDSNTPITFSHTSTRDADDAIDTTGGGSHLAPSDDALSDLDPLTKSAHELAKDVERYDDGLRNIAIDDKHRHDDEDGPTLRCEF